MRGTANFPRAARERIRSKHGREQKAHRQGYRQNRAEVPSVRGLQRLFLRDARLCAGAQSIKRKRARLRRRLGQRWSSRALRRGSGSAFRERRRTHRGRGIQPRLPLGRGGFAPGRSHRRPLFEQKGALFGVLVRHCPSLRLVGGALGHCRAALGLRTPQTCRLRAHLERGGGTPQKVEAKPRILRLCGRG